MKSALSTCFFALCLLLAINNNVRAGEQSGIHIQSYTFKRLLECCRKKGCPLVPGAKIKCIFQIHHEWPLAEDETYCYCSKSSKEDSQ